MKAQPKPSNFAYHLAHAFSPAPLYSHAVTPPITALSLNTPVTPTSDPAYDPLAPAQLKVAKEAAYSVQQKQSQ